MPTTPFTAPFEASLKEVKQSGKLLMYKGNKVVPQWNCCISGNTVGVNKDPVARLRLSATSLCVGDNLTADYSGSFSATSTLTTWSIDWGNGGSTGGAWPGTGSITCGACYTLPGTYTVKLTVTDMLGAEGYAEIEITAIDCLLFPLAELFCGAEAGGVWYSDDGGLDWDLVGLSGVEVYDLKASWFTYGELWVCAATGVYRTTNNGKSFGRVQTPAGITYKAIAVSKYDPQEVYLLGQMGTVVYLSRTTDSGNTWSSIDFGSLGPGATLIYAGAPTQWAYGQKMDHWGDSQFLGVCTEDNVVGVELATDTVTEYYGDANSTLSLSHWSGTPVNFHIAGGDGYFTYVPAHPLGPWVPLEVTYSYVDAARDEGGHSLDGCNISDALLAEGRIVITYVSGPDTFIYATATSGYFGGAHYITYYEHPVYGWGWWVFSQVYISFVTVASGGVISVVYHSLNPYYPTQKLSRRFVLDTYTGDTGYCYPRGTWGGTGTFNRLFRYNEITNSWGFDTVVAPGVINAAYVDGATQTVWIATPTGIYERDPVTLTYTLKCEFPGIRQFIRYYDVSAGKQYFYVFTNTALWKVEDGYSVGTKLPPEGFYHLLDQSTDGAYIYAALLYNNDTPGIIRAEFDLLNPTEIFVPNDGTWGGVKSCFYQSDKVWLFGDFGDGVKVLSCTDYGDTQDNVTEATWDITEVVHAILPHPMSPRKALAILNIDKDCWQTGSNGSGWSKRSNTPFATSCAVRDPWDDDVVLIGRQDDGTYHLRLSINEGATWQERSTDITPNTSITAIEVMS